MKNASRTTRLLVGFSVPLALAVGLTAGPAAASAPTPDHVKRSVGPIASDAPAGAVCDFAYHEEDTFTANITRFFDAAGNLVRVENQTDLSVLHRNSATGATLVEEVHYAAHVDLVNHEVRQTGQTWQLRDENGRLVLSGAGLIEIDIATGDVVRATPHVGSDLAQTVCPLLGGKAA